MGVSLAVIEIVVLAVVMFTPLFIVWAVVHTRKKRRLARQQTSALGFTMAELRASPNRLNPHQGRFRKVCMISGSSDSVGGVGGSAGGSAYMVYETFIVDRKGIIHNLEESTDDSVEIEGNAGWLADQLGIPFEGGYG
ncbi:MAG: hypothetical protein JRF63_09745 [Deltaproteobacteria bacterium]|nr:hypothetical protein [Deltaproteobacteria bacterium]